jgi:outer membrane beta-barrel protein
MRTIGYRSRSLLVVALGLLASTATAAPKKGGKGGGTTSAPKGDKSGGGSTSGGGDAGGEIEMDDSGKSGGGKSGGGGGGSTAGGGAGGGSAVDSGEIEMDDQANKPGDLSADLAASDQANAAVKTSPVKKTPLSWKDIVVVIRKPFLKIRRTELNPFVATTMNDNMIRHEAVGGEFNYWLTDVLAIGVEGQYMVHSFNEPYDLVARQARRLPTLNQYNWGTALDFHYVPVYGKFAIFDKKLITWEAFFTAGIGVGQSAVVPRDTKYPGFTNFLIEPNVGASMRFFLAKWLTVNIGVRDYIFVDKFEPTDRVMYPTATLAQDHADSSLINNIMFQAGLSFWLPTSFDYTTFR